MHKLLRHFLIALLALFSLSSCADKGISVSTSLIGQRHFSKEQGIEHFWVDKAMGGRIYLTDTGSGNSCCIALRYKKGTTVEVLWELWTPKEDTVRTYVADVPIEPFERSKGITGFIIHFYDNAFVRASIDDAQPRNHDFDSNDPLVNFPFPPEQLAKGRLIKLEKFVSERLPGIDYHDDEYPNEPDSGPATRRDCCWVTPEDKAKYAPKEYDGKGTTL
jgi:hypothetical protein